MHSLPVQIAAVENTFLFLFFISYEICYRAKSLMSIRNGGRPCPCVALGFVLTVSPLPWFSPFTHHNCLDLFPASVDRGEKQFNPNCFSSERLGQDTGLVTRVDNWAWWSCNVPCCSGWVLVLPEYWLLCNSLGGGWVLVGLSCKPSLFSPLSLGINSLCSVPSPAVA